MNVLCYFLAAEKIFIYNIWTLLFIHYFHVFSFIFQYLGKKGEVQSIDSDGDVEIKFENTSCTFFFNPNVVAKVTICNFSYFFICNCIYYCDLNFNNCASHTHTCTQANLKYRGIIVRVRVYIYMCVCMCVLYIYTDVPKVMD